MALSGSKDRVYLAGVTADYTQDPRGAVQGPVAGRCAFCDNCFIRSEFGRANIEAKSWKVLGRSTQNPLGWRVCLYRIRLWGMRPSSLPLPRAGVFLIRSKRFVRGALLQKASTR